MASQIVTILCPSPRDDQEVHTPHGEVCPVFDLWAYRSRRRAGKKTDVFSEKKVSSLRLAGSLPPVCSLPPVAGMGRYWEIKILGVIFQYYIFHAWLRGDSLLCTGFR